MKKIILILLLCAGVLIGYGQSNCAIKAVYLFYTETYPGIQMMDDNGNPVPPKAMVDRFLYIEWCSSKKPDIEKVLYNNIEFTAVLEKVEGRSVIPGIDLSPGNKTRIKATRCKRLWKVNLFPKQDGQVPEPGAKNMVVKIEDCVFTNKRETRLNILPRP